MFPTSLSWDTTTPAIPVWTSPSLVRERATGCIATQTYPPAARSHRDTTGEIGFLLTALPAFLRTLKRRTSTGDRRVSLYGRDLGNVGDAGEGVYECAIETYFCTCFRASLNQR